MSGYFKDTRFIKSGIGNIRVKYEFNVQPNDYASSNFVSTPSQTVTSFRSGNGTGVGSYPPFSDVMNALQGGTDAQFSNSVDTGHSFSTTKQSLGVSPRRFFYGHPDSVGRVTGNLGYRGPILASAYTYGEYLAIDDWSTNEINLMGAQAIRATAPTNTKSHLSEALIQLALGQEVPKPIFSNFLKILESRTDVFRRLSSEYLNLEFGWNPFVDDLKELVNTVLSYKKLVKQYERDSGRIVRRRYGFDPVNTVTIRNPVGNVLPRLIDVSSGFFGAGSKATNTQICTEVVEHRYYFSGAYTYFLPPLTTSNKAIFADGVERAMQLKNHLYGTSVTPSTIWEAAPWTWLFDWVANLGDILGNVSNFQTDNLVLKWGYIQRFSKTERLYSAVGLKLTGGVPLDFSASFTTVKKERAKATPYGFGINTATFTSWQWSILAALGMTNAPQKLRP